MFSFFALSLRETAANNTMGELVSGDGEKKNRYIINGKRRRRNGRDFYSEG